MSNDESVAGCFMAIFLCIALFLSVGWCANIYKLAQCDFKEPVKAEIIRTIGIFVVPMGGIAGWLTIEDGEDTNE